MTAKVLACTEIVFAETAERFDKFIALYAMCLYCFMELLK